MNSPALRSAFGHARFRPAQAGRSAVLLACTMLLLGGCLWEPKIEDKWTRVDMNGANVATGQVMPPGQMQTINIRSAITYRTILTGFAVAELRASATLSSSAVRIDPNADREPMAYAIDNILANSVSLGRATRAVTGWDHLIQPIDFTFSAVVPAMLDSAGVPVGAPAGLFLLTYLGSGVEVERADGSDTLIVTPFPSAQYQILPVGMTLSTR